MSATTLEDAASAAGAVDEFLRTVPCCTEVERAEASARPEEMYRSVECESILAESEPEAYYARLAGEEFGSPDGQPKAVMIVRPDGTIEYTPLGMEVLLAHGFTPLGVVIKRN